MHDIRKSLHRHGSHPNYREYNNWANQRKLSAFEVSIVVFCMAWASAARGFCHTSVRYFAEKL